MTLCMGDVLEATGAKLLAGDPERGVSGVSTDTRSLEPGDLFLALSGPNFDGNRYAGEAAKRGAAGLLLRADEGAQSFDVEGAPVAVVSDPRQALADLASWHRSRLSAEVIGITGSCGKTTTKNMLAELLREQRRTVKSPASFNNEIGVPRSILLADERTEALVLEIGTNAPGEIAALCDVARPTSGILTGIGASHLEGLGSIEGVAVEKGALLESLPADGFCVLGSDGRFFDELRARTEARVITFSLDGDADFTAKDLSFHPWGTGFTLCSPEGEFSVELPMLGQHMVQNLLASLAACHGMGLELPSVLGAVPRLVETRGRLERKRLSWAEGEVLVLDDAYNANPESVRAGTRVLAALSGHARRVLVLGDMHELGERSIELHHEVGAEAAALGLDLFMTIGARARAAAVGAIEAGMDPERVWSAPRLDEAAPRLSDYLGAGDVMLIKGSRAASLEGLVERLKEPLTPASG